MKVKFGNHEALIVKDVDYYLRHTAVANLINEGNYKTVLDVGGHGFGMSAFLPDTEVFELDSSHEAQALNPNCRFIRADARDMPLEDKSFDVVVSLRTLEQISPKTRQRFFSEIKRVGKEDFAFSILKKSNKFDFIEKIIKKNFNIGKIIDGKKDWIFICNSKSF